MDLTNIKKRDDAIDNICSNLIWSEILLRQHYGDCKVMLSTWTDQELANKLQSSWMSLDNYLANCWVLN